MPEEEPSIITSVPPLEQDPGKGGGAFESCHHMIRVLFLTVPASSTAF